MAVGREELPKALHDLAGRDYLSEVVVVSTCMRTEIYAVASRYHGAVGEIRKFLAAWSGEPLDEVAGALYEFYDETAVRHLFRVASGLDSSILGEGEVLGQVRDAWMVAQEEKASGTVMAILFRQAIETGKRVRSETAIARGTTSLSQAALALATERLGPLADKTALVIGAGEMGEAMAVALGDAHRVARLLVTNRTGSRAKELASRAGGRAVEWTDLPDALSEADVVLTSTGSSDVLFDADSFGPRVASRAGRPLLIIDIAVPRDIDPAVGTLPGVTLLDMDDLKSFAEAAMEERRRELPAAHAIVEEEVERHLAVAAQREVAPLVTSLRERAEAIRVAELARQDARLGSLDDRQRRAVDALTRGIVAKLLHEPTVNVKANAGSLEGDRLAAALQRLFDL
jgi:glutamyl-tRNA reductase